MTLLIQNGAINGDKIEILEMSELMYEHM